MDRLYRHFVRPGDLVFDIGAHVGDRVAAFRRLGARVVAVEPQPALVKTLRLLYGRDPMIAIEAVRGRTSARLDRIERQSRQPDRLDRVDRFHRGRRRRARLGRPNLVQALCGSADDHRCVDRAARNARLHQDRRRRLRGRGLGRPRATGSSAVVSSSPRSSATIALACIERCGALGYARFNAALGESQSFEHDDWIDAIRHVSLARRAAARSQFRRRLCASGLKLTRRPY